MKGRRRQLQRVYMEQTKKGNKGEKLSAEKVRNRRGNEKTSKERRNWFTRGAI